MVRPSGSYEMSKLTKLLRTPTLFFRDSWIFDGAKRKGRARVERPPPNDGRVPTYVIGFSPWKRFLRAWFPERNLIFLPRDISAEAFRARWSRAIMSAPGAEIFIWGMKVDPEILHFAREHGIACVHVEDGFIRSVALGATRTPPFSLCLDTQRPHFDARGPSDLEDLLATYDFAGDRALMERAERLMRVILETGISKYNHSTPVDVEAVYGPKDRKRVLVIGQVESDASIRYGSEKKYTNNDVVLLAAMANPEAQIIYKPHPDVLYGHRDRVSDPEVVRHLSLILEDMPLAQALETVDHAYTITSQGGFEALMRGIPVTTLGCPFYSGWGLTEDWQPNARRTRKLTVLEVFAAAYLLYPKYFDPTEGIHLTAEQAVERVLRLRESAECAVGHERRGERATRR